MNKNKINEKNSNLKKIDLKYDFSTWKIGQIHSSYLLDTNKLSLEP